MRRQRVAALIARRYPLYSGRGAIAKTRLFRVIAPPSSERVWTTAPGGYQVLASLDDYVGRAVYYFGDLDPKITWVCRRLVRAHDTVLDIGANMGLTTAILASLVGPRGYVHAFEPNPRLADCVAALVAHNGLENVRLHRIGLGDREEILPLVVPRDNSGAASLVRGSAGEAETLRVPVRRLGDVVRAESIDRVDFIKVDVEGFEPQVLEGARDVIARHRPRAVVFELNPSEGPVQEHPTVRIMREMDYCFFALPRRYLTMRAQRWDATSRTPPHTHDFVATPTGGVCEEVAAILKAN